MNKFVDSRFFERLLEILPGVAAWLFIFSPFILTPFVPAFVGIFILSYAFFWVSRSFNISRHLITGYLRMKRNVNLNWLELCKKSENLNKLEGFWEKLYKKNPNRYTFEDYSFVKNLKGRQELVKDWRNIIHVPLFAVSSERIEIIEPSIRSLLSANYPLKNIVIVVATEARFPDSIKDVKTLKEKYGKKFGGFQIYLHEQKEGEIVGKGPNISYAAKAFWKEFEGKLDPENVIVTSLDADHIVHPEYFGRLSYLYAINPNREHYSFQPIPLLFNNIWDAPPTNRISAVTSSFWQIIESMRPLRLRTFAAHSQPLPILLKADFWGIHTIVEDGHQYWRTYFALSGDHLMVPMFIPVYQDAVEGDNLWIATKNQYLQQRRWSWGASDFPYLVINCIKHKEIPLLDRLIQVFRLFAGNFTWSTASFFLATSWIPILMNKSFQDTVLGHNIATFSSLMLRFAWLALISNIWILLILIPPKPIKYGKHKYLEMIAQWILSPVVAVFLASLPALESQTRLMLGKRLEFWITPKTRQRVPKFKELQDLEE